MKPPLCLTIAASDPTGGAGVQADLRTMHGFGVRGLSVVTALTAQSTARGVTHIHVVPDSILSAQLAAIAREGSPDAVKIGALCSEKQIKIVTQFLERTRHGPVVWDPVLAPTAGKRFLPKAAREAARTILSPHVDIVTPNIDELAELFGITVTTARDLDALGGQLAATGIPWVLVKGGHLKGEPVDTLWRLAESRSGAGPTATYSCIKRYTHPRSTVTVHGSGCVLASALAAQLARGVEVEKAVHPAIAEVQRLFRREG